MHYLCKNNVALKKSATLHKMDREKSCEIQGSSQEVAVLVD